MATVQTDATRASQRDRREAAEQRVVEFLRNNGFRVYWDRHNSALPAVIAISSAENWIVHVQPALRTEPSSGTDPELVEALAHQAALLPSFTAWIARVSMNEEARSPGDIDWIDL